jgi:hypothetical protein
MPERLFYLRVRGLNLHILPAEAPFDAKIPVRHARVQRRSHANDLVVLLVYGEVAFNFHGLSHSRVRFAEAFRMCIIAIQCIHACSVRSKDLRAARLKNEELRNASRWSSGRSGWTHTQRPLPPETHTECGFNRPDRHLARPTSANRQGRMERASRASRMPAEPCARDGIGRQRTPRIPRLELYRS